jgi:hypothetical protein
MTTRQLSLNFLADSKRYRHDLIWQMVAEGFTNQRTADMLNRLGIKTPSGKEYYAKLIGATVSKLRKRKTRFSANTIKLHKMRLYRSEDTEYEHEGGASEST